MTDAAPWFPDLADGPEGGRAVWLRADDGVRLRAVIWPEGARGTVLIFPGRTEYAEKYGPAAADLARRGYASVAVDWRGQGLADRLLPDPMAGHVGAFGDYQKDVAALMRHLRDAGLPRPFFLMAHSMGGAIGLRALIERLEVRAAVFSAPMWGIALDPWRRPLALVVAGAARLAGRSAAYVPTTGPGSYVATAPFEGNVLTRDRAMFAWMQGHLRARPDLALGGPTLHWLDAALRECRVLAARACPRLPALAVVGSAEKVVEIGAIEDRMRRWPGGRLMIVPGAEHEVMMEGAATRAAFFDAAADLFGGA